MTAFAHALEAYHQGALVFRSDAGWIHPLFELEARLPTLGVSPRELDVRDRVVGAASAFFAVHLGFRSLHAGVLSHRGEAVLRAHHVAYACDTRVPRIGCQTEDVLRPTRDVADAMMELRRRRAAAGSTCPFREDTRGGKA